MMNRRNIAAAALAACLTASALAGCGGRKADEPVIRIGVIEPLTGANGAAGFQEMLGIDRHLAVRPQISVQAVGHPEILPVRVRVPEAGLQLQIAQLHKLLFADLVRRAPVDA